LAGALYARAFLKGRIEPEALGASAFSARTWRESFSLGLLDPLAIAREGVEVSRAEFGDEAPAREGALPLREAPGTAKVLFRAADGAEFESVRIPMHAPAGALRHTLCISSQVGCRMGCAFCETGLGGLRRNLLAAEIVAQYVTVTTGLGWDIGNLVFMGMGEPLDNFDALAAALAVFLDASGPAFAQEEITVCTSGLPDGIRKLRALGYKRLNLSVSLNGPDDSTRTRLMPINRSFGLASLAAALADYPQRRNFSLAVNYCLVPGLNDGDGAPEGVAAFLAAAAPPGRALVNLIPYNPGSKPLGLAPTEAQLSDFQARLEALGVQVKLRAPRGRGLMAACGQLGSKTPACTETL
jgi:23S rRNA (adenine2503-C2)-methyltransferase